jgi:hypothetical protein
LNKYPSRITSLKGQGKIRAKSGFCREYCKKGKEGFSKLSYLEDGTGPTVANKESSCEEEIVEILRYSTNKQVH